MSLDSFYAEQMRRHREKRLARELDIRRRIAERHEQAVDGAANVPRPAISRPLGWATLFMIGTDLFVLSPVLPDIAREMDVPVPVGGATVAVFALAYLVAGPSLGALADRRGRHRVLVAALAAFALANLATALAPGLAALVGARALAGAAASGVTPSVYALVGEGAPAQRRARRLAVVTSGLLLALATGAPAGSLLGAAVGWRGVFALLTVAAVAVLCVTAVRTRSGDRVRPPVAGRPEEAAARRPAPSGRRLASTVVPRLRAVAPTTLWAMAVYGLYTYLGTIVGRDAGFAPGMVALALVCFGAGALLGNLVGGIASDRRGGRIVCVVALLALAGAEIAVASTVHAPRGMLLGALGAVALAGYPYFSAQQSRLLAACPRASGSLLAWNNSAMYAGILLASAAGGVLLTTLGASALALAAAAAALLASGAAVVSIPPSSRVRSE